MIVVNSLAENGAAEAAAVPATAPLHPGGVVAVGTMPRG